jgi:hypothetical protein
MSLARTTADYEIGNAFPFSSLRDSIKQTTIQRNARISAIDQATIRIRREEEEREREREARRKLALNLIDRGYKSLAAELHPDKAGGSSEMKRLNQVRSHLRDMA